MKLIKQNDSAGGLIFKQNTKGKAMKQNYTMGKAFRASSTGIYLDIPGLIGLLLPSFTISYFSTRIGNGYSTPFAVKLQNGNRATNNVTDSEFRFFGPSLTPLEYAPVVQRRGDVDYTAIKTISGMSWTSSPIEEFKINGFYDTTVQNLNSKMGEIRIYDRNITIEESEYALNNFLFNEPLSGIGLLVRLLNNSAEILDFDGIGLRVGIRDISGLNNHGRLMGLPSGTLEEIRDWANANLFELW